MSRKLALKLLDTDAKVSVFAAEVGEFRKRHSVHVYPRKTGPGFIWVVRGPMDLDDVDACVIDGGLRVDPIRAAAAFAVRKLFQLSGR